MTTQTSRWTLDLCDEPDDTVEQLAYNHFLKGKSAAAVLVLDNARQPLFLRNIMRILQPHGLEDEVMAVYGGAICLTRLKVGNLAENQGPGASSRFALVEMGILLLEWGCLNNLIPDGKGCPHVVPNSPSGVVAA